MKKIKSLTKEIEFEEVQRKNEQKLEEKFKKKVIK